MPLPFSRGVFICGDPITVERKSSDEALEQKRLHLEKTLNELTEQADNYFD